MEKKVMWLAPKTMTKVALAAAVAASLGAGAAASAWATDGEPTGAAPEAATTTTTTTTTYDQHTQADPYASTFFSNKNTVAVSDEAGFVSTEDSKTIAEKIATSAKPVELTTGWYKVDKIWYYYQASNPSSTGGFYTGTHKIGDMTYFFNTDGTLVTSKFVKVQHVEIVKDADEAAKKWTDWDDKVGNHKDTQDTSITNLFYVNEDGYQQFGWTQIGTEWFHFADKDSVKPVPGEITQGWYEYNKDWYYLQTISAKEAEHGQMVTNTTIEQNGVTYHINKDGIWANGWVQEGKKWNYYAGGIMVKDSWKLVDGTWYSFDKDGVMQTGFAEVKGKTYFFADWGGLQLGWFYVGEDTPYAEDVKAEKSDTILHKKGDVKYAKGWYHADKDGAVETIGGGWKSVDGKWYFFQEDGHMFDKATAYGKDDLGKTYEFSFDASGAWTGTKELGVMTDINTKDVLDSIVK